MKSALTRCVAALTLLAFAGCTSMQVITDFTPSKIRARVHAGDQVSIMATNGQAYDLEVTKVEADALYGYTLDHKHHYKMPFEAISAIEVQKVSKGRSWTAFGVTIGVAVAAFIFFLIRGLQDSGAGGGSGSSSGGGED